MSNELWPLPKPRRGDPPDLRLKGADGGPLIVSTAPNGVRVQIDVGYSDNSIPCLAYVELERHEVWRLIQNLASRIVPAEAE